MRRALALLAAASLLGAAPAGAEAKPRAKSTRFAPKCTTQKRPCRSVRGWLAAPRTPLSAPAPAPPPVDAPVAPAGEEVVTDVVQAPPPPAPLCDPSPWLGAIAEDVNDFRLRLTRTCVPAGTVLFQFRNDDLAFHNLWAEGSDPVRPPRQVVEDTPGETMVTRSAQLTAGEWRLYCSLPGHEAMTRLVDVTSAG